MSASRTDGARRGILRITLIACGVASAVALARGVRGGDAQAGSRGTAVVDGPSSGPSSGPVSGPSPALELPGFRPRVPGPDVDLSSVPTAASALPDGAGRKERNSGALANSASERTTSQPIAPPIRPPRAGGPAPLQISRTALARSIETDIANALVAAKKVRKGDFDASSTTIAVAVVDAATGDVLVDRLGSTALRPASNLKVITAAAALLGLGVDAHFETRLEAHGTIDGGRLNGDLVVRAGADPMHRRDGDGSVLPWLEPAAQAVRAAGVRTITGRILLDEGSFERPGPAPEWPDDSQWWTDYCALSGGFSANGGVFRATVTAPSLRSRAQLKLRPRFHGLDEDLGVRTKKGDLNVRVGATARAVTVKGTVPKLQSPWVKEFRHPDPVELFGHSLVGALNESGIRVDGFSRERVGARDGTLLHTIRTPITTVLPAILLDSNNAVTDQLFYLVGSRLGGSGTREQSAQAIKNLLAQHGVRTDALTQVDGSGLSRATRTSARLLVDTLRALRAASPSGWRVFADALPEAGRTGSLAKRMRGTAAEGFVRGKTGWISGVSAISGVVLDEGGDARLAYSIIVNYPRVGGLNKRAWKPMQNAICTRLAEAVRAPVGAGR